MGFGRLFFGIGTFILTLGFQQPCFALRLIQSYKFEFKNPVTTFKSMANMTIVCDHGDFNFDLSNVDFMGGGIANNPISFNPGGRFGACGEVPTTLLLSDGMKIYFDVEPDSSDYKILMPVSGGGDKVVTTIFEDSLMKSAPDREEEIDGKKTPEPASVVGMAFLGLLGLGLKVRKG